MQGEAGGKKLEMKAQPTGTSETEEGWEGGKERAGAALLGLGDFRGGGRRGERKDAWMLTAHETAGEEMHAVSFSENY